MSSEPYTKVSWIYANDLTAYRQYSRSVGRKNTGIDRSRPSPYSRQFADALKWRVKNSTGETAYNPQNPTSRSIHPTEALPFGEGGQAARNKAYERFRDKALGETASLGAAIAEAGESLGMIQQRATGLYRAYKDLRKGDFRGCLRQLSVDPKRKHRNIVRTTAQEASGLWLEYWFGWSPSISDIYTAADQFTAPMPAREKYHGSAKHVFKVFNGSQRLTGTRRTRTGAVCALVNPNLALLNQMGLANPASVAWEVIPFSFLIDWVFDVSSCISSFTDFVGVELSDKYTSETTQCIWEILPGNGFSGSYVASQVFMERRLQLVRPLPNFEVSRNLGTKLTRATSALSLLTQILAK